MSFSPNVELPGDMSDATSGRSTQQSPTEVLPIVVGRGRVVARPITRELHWHFQNTKTQSIAYVSCAFELCHGPVDEFLSIIINGKSYHGIYKRRDVVGGDYCEQVVGKAVPETFRLYWGEEDQANPTSYIQSRIRDASHPLKTATHPRFGGRAILVVTNLEAGNASSGKTPPIPKIEIELFIRSQSGYDFGHSSIGHPPICTIRDLLTRKRGGLKLGSDVIDGDDWDDAATDLNTNGIAGITGADLWTSHVFDKARSALDHIKDVASYFYGFLKEQDGKLNVGWQPADGTTADPTGLREITLHHMAGEPQLLPEGLDKMPTKVIVTGLDWLSKPALQEDSADAMVPFARRLLGEDRAALQLSRPGYVQRSQLAAAAKMEALTRSNPSMKVRMTVLRQYATHADGTTPLRPGDLFTLDWEPLELDVVMRVLERSKETAVEVELLAEVERGAFPRPYNNSLDAQPDIDALSPADLVRYSMAQMPPDLSDAADTRVCALVERPSTSTLGFDVEFSPDNSFPGQSLDSGNIRWATACQLVGSLASGLVDTTINVDEVGEDFDTIVTSRSALEKADDQLLIYHGGEWLSIGTVTDNEDGTYTLAVSRARLASLPAAHADNDVLFIIPRGDLLGLTHSDFANVEASGSYDETTATKYFKLRSYNAADTSDWSTATSLVLRDPTPDKVEDLLVTFNARAAKLTWSKVEGALVNEYQVDRATGPGYADWAQVGEVTSPTFVDVVPAYDVAYKWRVRAMATDETEGIDSDTVTGTATGADVDLTTPSTPSAPTFNAEDSYLADDGTGFSYIQINLPAMPSGADLYNVLYRRSGNGGWIVGDQREVGGGVARIDDLSMGVAYQFAIKAFSRWGQPSAVSSVLSRTAPNGLASPSGVGGLSATGYLENITLRWDPNSEKNFQNYEVWKSATNSIGTASKLADVNGTVFVDTAVSGSTTYYYWLRAVTRGPKYSGFTSSVSAMRGEQSGGGGGGDRVSLTLIGHASNFGSPVYNGGAGVTTWHDVDDSVPINADANVSGDNFGSWGGEPVDLALVGNTASNSTTVDMKKNVVLYANY